MFNITLLIALGANLYSEEGTPAHTFVRAFSEMVNEGLQPCAVSRFYRSPAFPAGSGPDYVNACAVVQTNLSPVAALEALHRIEARLGRVRHKRWGARGIDLDLLAAGDAILPNAQTQAQWRALPLEEQMRVAPEQLILPHPRLAERAFVLIPLAEIAPQWRHPATGRSVAEMLAALPEAEKAALTPFERPFDEV